MPDNSTLKAFSDYGALGLLVVVLLAGAWKLWSELKGVREDSDLRAKRYQDQLEAMQREAIQRYQDGVREVAAKFADTVTKQSEMYASSVRELNASSKELLAALLEKR